MSGLSRYAHTAGVIKDEVTLNEHIIVTGGLDSSPGSPALDSVEIMFNSKNKWTQGNE